MSQDERWMGRVVRHGVEARLDGRNTPTRVMVFLEEDGSVQWGPTGGPAVQDHQTHSFHFWVHAETDSERLDAIQILGTKLLAAGHSWEVFPVLPGRQP